MRHTRSHLALLVTALLSACGTLQTGSREQQVEEARARAVAEGNSGPLYELYETCLNRNWQRALEAGDPVPLIYEAGLAQCSYELDVLCDYYGVPSCHQDAGVSGRLLFTLLLDGYRDNHRVHPVDGSHRY